MSIRKCLMVFAVSLCVMSANALSVAFQIMQNEDSKSDVRAACYQIENGLFDFFFDKGIIISNSPVVVSDDKSEREVMFNQSMMEAEEGGVRYFVELVCDYDVSGSTNPEAALLENIKVVTWKVIDLKTDRTLGSGKKVPPAANLYKKAEKGVMEFSYGIATDIYKIIRR
ncbi:MAG: hypothetical protein KBS64_02085 [Treponema sp.]|nr:hypothetical protein [Candidatus Treponema equi]